MTTIEGTEHYKHKRRRYFSRFLVPGAPKPKAYTTNLELEEPTADKPANLISSLCEDGLHRPALDIDIPMKVFASSTPGHHHVYFPTVALTWGAYVKLLEALVEAGIIEEGYYRASVWRKQTLLRPPEQPHKYKIPTTITVGNPQQIIDHTTIDHTTIANTILGHYQQVNSDGQLIWGKPQPTFVQQTLF